MKRENFFARLDRGIKKLVGRFYNWLCRNKRTSTLEYEVCVLKSKLQDNQRLLDGKHQDIETLENQLSKVRADNYELQRKHDALKYAFSDVLTAPADQLKEASPYEVRQAEEGNYEVVTGHCCLGGCDMDICAFSSERDALLFTALLKAAGIEPAHNTACGSCYAEYMHECL